MTTTHDQVEALAPLHEALDPDWSTDTLARIVADEHSRRRPTPWWRRGRGRAVALAAAGAVTLSAGAAVAGAGPADVVRDAIVGFARHPNTSGNGLGTLPEPRLVAAFHTDHGLYAVWIAVSSTGKVCTVETDGTWDGTGTPTRSQLTGYGCDEQHVSHRGRVEEITRADQIGGFFKDDHTPLIYGVSPYPDAARVRVRGVGVDRTLAVRADSHGFGALLPRAGRAKAVTMTYLDAEGHRLGSARWVAPVG